MARLVVAILDGWGISFLPEGNAVLAAQTPALDTFAAAYPAAAIAAAGIEVGLPWGEVGNSETGHKNIGAGSVQYQTLEEINQTIADKSFFKNAGLSSALEHVKKNKSQLHLMGLVSSGGVHAHISHLFALLKLCQQENLQENVFIHMFTDGRDSPPKSALSYLAQLEQKITEFGVGKIASVTGRFYAMDRNKNWDRTQATFDMLTGGPRGSGAPTARQAIENAYAQNILDEAIPPTAVTRGGAPMTEIRDGDAVIFFNFRPDRAVQLTQLLRKLPNVLTVAFFETFKEKPAEYPLARVLSENNLTQLHLGETEKYAHITYYLNVGHEKPFPGEEHLLIESGSTKNFADKPEMAAAEITAQAIESLAKFDVIFINYANADMVGHTGNFEAAVKACETIDTCLGKLHEAAQNTGAEIIITADHGNEEEMQNVQTGEVSTDHTANPVPFYYVSEALRRTEPKSESEIRDILSSPIGVLADVAPTILDILKLPKPPQMTGVSLLNSLR